MDSSIRKLVGAARPHALGAVIRALAERPARRPQAALLLFVQTKSNQKVAKTKGFGFLYNFGFILRPRLSLTCLNRYRPLTWTFASIRECS